jgi:hypothetical protein
MASDAGDKQVAARGVKREGRVPVRGHRVK